MKIIVCGLKIVGRDFVQHQIDLLLQADKLTNMVIGFDLVCEEDYNPGTDHFLDQIYELKMKLGDKFACFMHAGESYQRTNTELYDAILLGSKRIGHGFALSMHPNLIKIVKEKDICIETCPVSNKLLCCVNDLRLHPIRTLLAQGVPVSVNPDDHGFFQSEGVTMDYLYAYLEWGLDLSDLKQLCLNSLEYATITEEEKV